MRVWLNILFAVLGFLFFGFFAMGMTTNDCESYTAALVGACLSVLIFNCGRKCNCSESHNTQEDEKE